MQDRFHRFYWVLPRLGVPLVESIASAGLRNPAVNVDVTCRQDPPSIAGSLLFNLIDFKFAEMFNLLFYFMKRYAINF